jgi:hypothetical protein
MQSQDTNKNNNKKDMDIKPQYDDSKFAGSTITDPEEKELRKLDDWHSHKHSKHHNDQKDAGCFREGELHGVVGKEIHDEVEREKRGNLEQLKHKPKETNKFKPPTETK